MTAFIYGCFDALILIVSDAIPIRTWCKHTFSKSSHRIRNERIEEVVRWAYVTPSLIAGEAAFELRTALLAFAWRGIPVFGIFAWWFTGSSSSAAHTEVEVWGININDFLIRVLWNIAWHADLKGWADMICNLSSVQTSWHLLNGRWVAAQSLCGT
jgi:hypothetical protein